MTIDVKSKANLYSVSDTQVRVLHAAAGHILPEFPVQIYTVVVDPYGILYLDVVPAIPANVGRLYGNVERQAQRVLNTYNARNASTGAAFYGYKGTGKTLTVREICHLGLAQGLPVIMVEKQFDPMALNNFISSINRRCIVVFEEFDKVFTEEQCVDGLLTLLDGMHTSNKLYLFSTNDDLPEYFCNRPSRIYYRFEFGNRLEASVVQQYLDDHLSEASAARRDEIMLIASIAEAFNFDMLQAIVEESNRYPDDAIEDLVAAINIDANVEDIDFVVNVYANDMEITGLLSYIDGDSLMYGSNSTQTVKYRVCNDGYNDNIQVMKLDPKLQEFALRLQDNITSEMRQQLVDSIEAFLPEELCTRQRFTFDFKDSEYDEKTEQFVLELDNGVTLRATRRARYGSNQFGSFQPKLNKAKRDSNTFAERRADALVCS